MYKNSSFAPYQWRPTVAGNKFDSEEVDAIYELGDSNGDEVLDLGEFIAIMFPAAGEAIAKLRKVDREITSNKSDPVLVIHPDPDPDQIQILLTHPIQDLELLVQFLG